MSSDLISRGQGGGDVPDEGDRVKSHGTAVRSARLSALFKLGVQVKKKKNPTVFCHVQKGTGTGGAADNSSGGQKTSPELFINPAYERRRKSKINKEIDFPETVFLSKQTKITPQKNNKRCSLCCNSQPGKTAPSLPEGAAEAGRGATACADIPVPRKIWP